MYNIADLNAMSDDELIKVAETMGMKKVDLTNKDDVIYGILDQQAINHATSANEIESRFLPRAKGAYDTLVLEVDDER